jgi:transposase
MCDLKTKINFKFTHMETKDSNKRSATQLVNEIKRRTKRKFSSEEKIKIVLEGLRGEESIAAICRKYAINTNSYFKWSKDFIEAGKRRLSGDILREANRDEVLELKKSVDSLKRMVGELYIQNDELKKTLSGLEQELL